MLTLVRARVRKAYLAGVRNESRDEAPTYTIFKVQEPNCGFAVAELSVVLKQPISQRSLDVHGRVPSSIIAAEKITKRADFLSC